MMKLSPYQSNIGPIDIANSKPCSLFIWRLSCYHCFVRFCSTTSFSTGKLSACPAFDESLLFPTLPLRTLWVLVDLKLPSSVLRVPSLTFRTKSLSYFPRLNKSLITLRLNSMLIVHCIVTFLVRREW